MFTALITSALPPLPAGPARFAVISRFNKDAS